MINYSTLTEAKFYDDYYRGDGMVSLQDNFDYFNVDIRITVGRYVSIRLFCANESNLELRSLEPNEIWPKLFLQGFIV